MSKSKKLISIVVPCYNEEANIEGFYDAFVLIFHQLSDFDFEVVCVDDGSSDNTLEKLIDLTKKDNRYNILELSRNFGKEAALTAGIDFARGDAVIPIDIDLQDPPSLIPNMIDEWVRGAEVVLARRINRESESFSKRKTAELFYRVHNLLSTIKIPENVGDYRLMDRVVVDALKQ